MPCQSPCTKPETRPASSVSLSWGLGPGDLSSIVDSGVVTSRSEPGAHAVNISSNITMDKSFFFIICLLGCLTTMECPALRGYRYNIFSPVIETTGENSIRLAINPHISVYSQ